MTPDEFRRQRRQVFLTLEYYELNQKLLAMLMAVSFDAIRENNGVYDSAPANEDGIFKDKLKLLKLHYTAGRPIEELIPFYTDVVDAFGAWTDAYRAYVRGIAQESGEELLDDGTPLRLEDLHHYQLLLDVVSLGLLLGQGDALRNIRAWTVACRDTDLLFEELIAPAVDDPLEQNSYFHTRPYDPLIDALYALDDPAEASAKVKEYLDGWYKSFEGVPWHDGHLHAVEGEYMPYYGYWAFEAAAICLLHDIDDSSFRDHMVYPKDLADWARANHSLDKLKPGAGAATDSRPSRCAGGEPCPRTGWWFTPAKADSRRYFQQGERFPDYPDSDYGSTFWQWAVDQDAPKLGG